MIYEFEFDQAKSEANKAKHGIDFVEAQKLWDDEFRHIYEARYVEEVRWNATARLNNKYWSAFYTWRDNLIRLISVRRAREEEIERYDANYRRRIG
jgi:uncharacterized protein